MGFDNAMIRLRPAAGLLPVAGLLLIAGCGTGDEIEHYSIPKPEAIAQRHGIEPGQQAEPAQPVPTRMLAAIVLQGSQGWFFKLTGPPDTVEGQKAAFDKFLESVHFVRSLPKWDIPSAWREEPGRAMRFATIRIPAGEHSLELTVTNLPREEENKDAYLLANVNRWRGQLGLGPIKAADLPKQTKTIKLATGEAMVVDIEGESATGGGMAAPFAGGAGGGPFAGPMAGGPMASGRPHPPIPDAAPANRPGKPSANGPAAAIHYETPPDWHEAPAGGMRKAAFTVGKGEKPALVTVIDLGPEAGGWLANVNRWRGQLELPPVDEQEAEKLARPITVEGEQARYVELAGPADAGPRQGMLAAMVEHDGKNWFIKLAGDAAIVQREKVHFEDFVRSLRLGPPAGRASQPAGKPDGKK